MSVEAKTICNLLLNIPREDRNWILENVSPDTFRRWVRQMNNGILDRKELIQRFKNLRTGKEELSDLAKYEKSVNN